VQGYVAGQRERVQKARQPGRPQCNHRGIISRTVYVRPTWYPSPAAIERPPC
jgi:hypothetical protein